MLNESESYPDVANCVGVDRAPTRLPRRPRPTPDSLQPVLAIMGTHAGVGRYLTAGFQVVGTRNLICHPAGDRDTAPP